MMRQLKTLLPVTIALLPAAALFAQAQLMPPLTNHVRDAVRTGTARFIQRMPTDQVLQLNVVLPLSDRPGLNAFLKALYDPSSTTYRQYLTPQQFTARFGPTQAQYDAAVSYLQSNGLTIVGGSRDGMDIQVKGPVSVIENAFHITMGTYQHPTENRTFYSPDREPTTTLPFQLWHVSGLDNYSIPHPLYVSKTAYAQAHGMSPDALVKHATTGSGPSASFLGSDMRAAYYGNGPLTGAGQTVGLFEYEGTDLADLSTYYSKVGQTQPLTPVLYSVDGTSTSCVYSSGCDDTEQTLDMTQALGMAPGLSSLVVFIGSTDTAIISKMTTYSPLPSTIGCSWGWTPADPNTLDIYFQKMASQGQTFFAASGDSSTWSSKNEAWPADDANVVSVGGTDLTTQSAAGPWASETAWSDSGGGISPDGIPIPSYQQFSGVINSSNAGSTTYRNGPDVSANANFTFFVCANQTTCTANEYGGTSFAAPMWAGFVALANQQAIANGASKGVGFINPTIYQQNVTSAYGTNFHDITSGISGSYTAVSGYDLVTGWGSPKAALITALVGGGSTTPSFSLSASPGSVSVAQGASGSTTITSTASNGFNSNVTLSASGQPSGVTVSFATNPITGGSGTSNMGITVASTVSPGTYTITVTGTPASGTAQSTSVTLTVTGTSNGTFSISVSPTSGYLYQGQSGYAVVTTSVSGGFSSAIALSATGVPSGVTYSFTPASIAAPGSGTAHFNLSVSRSARPGTYPITITGTGGTQSHSTTLTFQIIRY
jgi:kumamolisin